MSSFVTPRRSPRVLVVDHHDSFTFTLVSYLEELGADVVVVESDAVTSDSLINLASTFDGVVLSPGPGAPEESPAAADLVRSVVQTQAPPLLGVCLGHQIIVTALGGVVGRAPELMHGQASTITHSQSGVFSDVPQDVTVGRYHSLAAQSLPSGIRLTAETPAGTIMGLAHETAPIQGVQFHPESVLTEHGHAMLANWLRELSGPSR